ncbi:ArsA family ATPase [Tsukamurella serpentis]
MAATVAATKVLLVAGAGGCGRTTVATALAARAATGGPTLLVTIGRVVDPLLAAGAAGFDHVHLNPVELLAQWWEGLSSTVKAGRGLGNGAVKGATAGFDPFALEPPELTGLADAEHVLVLRAIRGHAQSGRYRTVVIDGPAFDGLVSLLAAPAALAAYLERVWPRHVRLSGPGAGAVTGSLAALLLAEPVAGLADQLAGFVADRSALEIVYLLTGDGGRPDRARGELAALEVLGLRPIALVLNRVFALDDRFALDLPHPAVRVVGARVAAQDDAREALAELSTVLRRPVLEVNEADEPITDLSAACAVHVDAGALLDAEPLPTPEPQVRPIGGEGLDVRYEWVLELPLVDAATIGLGRVEEDLLIDAHGVRRRMRLPSVLRRCVVAGATYTEGELRVTFAPDPQVWPRG